MFMLQVSIRNTAHSVRYWNVRIFVKNFGLTRLFCLFLPISSGSVRSWPTSLSSVCLGLRVYTCL